MDFNEAMYYLAQGRKIRRKCWDKDNYIYKSTDEVFKDHILSNDDTIYYVFHIENDWELYDDRKETTEEIKTFYKLLKKLYTNCSTSDEYDDSLLQYLSYESLYLMVYALENMNKDYKINEENDYGHKNE